MSLPMSEIIAEQERLRGHKRPWDGANIRFGTSVELDKQQTEIQGRNIYRDVEIVSVQWPGQSERVVPVSDQHRQMYALEYNAWKANQEIPDTGTPLTHWPLVTPAQVKELQEIGFKTVEQLSEASGTAQKKLLGMHHLVDDAKNWLDAAESDQSKTAALQKQVKSQKTKIKKLQDQLEDALRRIEEGGL